MFERFVNWALWILSRPFWWLLMLELHLLLRDAQRAEYLADALAAETAGTPATVALEEKLLLEPAVRAAVQRVSRAADSDVFAAIATAFRSVSPRELERRRRVARLASSRLSDTHPPTARRLELLERRERREPRVVLELLERRERREPRVVLEPERSVAIDRELERRRPSLQRTLVDDYRESVFA